MTKLSAEDQALLARMRQAAMVAEANAVPAETLSEGFRERASGAVGLKPNGEKVRAGDVLDLTLSEEAFFAAFVGDVPTESAA